MDSGSDGIEKNEKCRLPLKNANDSHIFLGITALADCLKTNSNLRMLNINDNTVTERGIESLVIAFDSCEMIEKLDLGDCLLRSKGAKILSRKLCHLKRLRSLNLSYNEIDASAGKMIVNAVATSVRDWIILC